MAAVRRWSQDIKIRQQQGAIISSVAHANDRFVSRSCDCYKMMCGSCDYDSEYKSRSCDYSSGVTIGHVTMTVSIKASHVHVSD